MSPELLATCQQILALLGDGYYTLIGLLDDNFMIIDQDTQLHLWKQVLRAINQGERKPHTLARILNDPNALLMPTPVA